MVEKVVQEVQQAYAAVPITAVVRVVSEAVQVGAVQVEVVVKTVVDVEICQMLIWRIIAEERVMA